MKRVLSVILSLVFAITLMAQDVATSATKQVTCEEYRQWYHHGL